MNNPIPIKSQKTPFALLKNVASLAILVERLQSRHVSMPGLGVFYGYSGYGKTHAGIYAQNRFGCIKVDFCPVWTIKWLFQAILSELGEDMRHATNPALMARIIERLAAPDAPVLIIDEADGLVDKNMIEIIRAIHDASNASIILIGEERLPAKMERSERTHNRVLEWVPAQPCDLEDAQALARSWHPDLTFTDAMLQKLLIVCRGEARRLTTNLDYLADWSRRTGTTTLDPQTYDGPFNDGKAPARRINSGRVA